MNVEENGSVAKASVQNMAAFLFKWQDEDGNEEGWTILIKNKSPWPVI